MNKANLKKWILDTADGEPIEAVVLGTIGGSIFEVYAKKIPNYNAIPKGELLTWEQAAPFIDYDFDADYGFPGCHAIVSWTSTKIITVGQYDGATWPYYLPRNPIAFMPEMAGG